MKYMHMTVRELGDAIHAEMDKLRKAILKAKVPPEKGADIWDAMGTVREMFDEYGAMAEIRISDAQRSATNG